MASVCFGETLWDMLPTGRQPGGAPFNVAVHLRQLGQPVQLISRVGDDEPGTVLLDFLAARDVPVTLVQHDATHPTGVVAADVHNRQEVTYQIVQPVAWDYIAYTKALREAVAAADMFVFGSLAARLPVSRATLYQLLPQARFRVFDVNMRPPHYTRPVVEHLLEHADLVKLNHHELAEILAWFGQENQEETALAWLATCFQLQAVCVTKGADGAVLWQDGQLYRSAGIAVAVQDTIGSGDAFLAVLLAGWATQSPPHRLRLACAAGSLVATCQGATPAITAGQVADFLARQPA